VERRGAVSEPAGERVLLADDDDAITELVGSWLRRAGYAVEVAASAAALGRALQASLPDVVCLDLQLPDGHGLELLPEVLARGPSIPVIIMTSDAGAESAVAAMKGGAYDYLTKPLTQARVLTTVARAAERGRLGLRLRELEREAEGGGYPGIIGASPAMRALFRQLDRVGPRDISVLIHGESGTGKERVAHALHAASPRRGGPLVILNCAAIPEALQESELFGHERGAFTGATEQRRGRFELADQGTLFLDEVAELSPSLQAKLLRVLQERTFSRLGSAALLRSDFRLVAASHRDLAQEVAAGRFRADLYFRLAVFELEVPPLRDRDGDLVRLAEHFLLRLRQEAGEGPTRFSPDALAVLGRHAWPGNVRELENAVHRAAVLATGEVVEVAHLPPRLAAPPSAPPAPAPPSPGVSRSMEAIERAALEEALARAGGNVSEAVRQLGVGRTTFYRKLKKYGLTR
jgi:two-component system response regulator HydG